MAGLQTSVGLMSGIDIQGVVKSLIALEAVPRDNLQARQERLQSQQAALVKLTDLFNTTTYMIRNLGKVDVFSRRDVKSSDESVLKATRTNSNPQPGNYQITPLQLAQTQTTLATGVASDKTALGKEGEISIKFGPDLETNYSLSDINGGYGFDRGYMRITDGTGARANVDLRTAQTMDDILEAINTCIDIDIFAEMEGDHIKLTDYSGGTGTMVIQEVNNGTTAASLGLIGSNIQVEDGVLRGNNLLYLGADMDLSILNDGNGLSINSYLDDLSITLSDGTKIEVDFSELIPATSDSGQQQTYTTTVGDVLDAFNKAAAEAGTTDDGKAKFVAQFRSDGKGFELIDNTGTTGMTISQHSYNPSAHNPILYQLGFADYGSESVTYTGGKATGRAVLGDMDSVLLSSLDGGRGFSMETVFDNVDENDNAIFAAQDRNGNLSYMTMSRSEFASCETLADMTRLLNNKLENAVLYDPDTNPPEPYADKTGLGLKFQINSDKTGLELVDTTGNMNGTMMFSDLPDHGGHISAMLGFGTGVSADASKISGGDLYLQTVSKNTKIADMNGGSGVNLTGASLMIVDSSSTTNSSGNTTGQAIIDLEKLNPTSLGDIINHINTQSNLDVIAKINKAGDGIIIEDNANGAGTFSVTLMSGDKNVLKQLGIQEGTAKNTFDTDGTQTGVASLSGSTKYSVTVEKEDSLDDIRQKINDLGIGVQATIINDGSSKPYRLSISGSSTGAAGAFKVDLFAIGLGSSNMSKAQDAIILYGDPNNSSSLLVNSSSNTFSEVVSGISFTISSTSKEPINVWTENSSSDIKASLTAFVENYNKFRDFYNEVTLVDVKAGTKGLLAMDSTILKLGSDMSNLLLTVFNPNGAVRCLQDLGISITPVTQTEDGDVIDQYSGKITFDETVFDRIFESNPKAIEEFFVKSQDTLNEKGEVVQKYVGYVSKWENLYHSYSYYPDSSALNAKYNSMQTQIEKNDDRLGFLQERLDVKQVQLLKKFYAMETALASMQGSMSVINNIGSALS